MKGGASNTRQIDAKLVQAVAKPGKYQPLHAYQVFLDIFGDKYVRAEVKKRWLEHVERVKKGEASGTYTNAEGKEVKMLFVNFQNMACKELLRNAPESEKAAVQAKMDRLRQEHLDKKKEESEQSSKPTKTNQPTA